MDETEQVLSGINVIEKVLHDIQIPRTGTLKLDDVWCHAYGTSTAGNTVNVYKVRLTGRLSYFRLCFILPRLLPCESR